MSKENLRIRPNGKNGFYVQLRIPFLLILHRWKNIYECDTFGEALLVKTNFIPKEVFNQSKGAGIGTSGNIMRV